MRTIAMLAFGVGLTLGPVVLFIADLDNHRHAGWRIGSMVYLAAFAVPSLILSTRAWFRQKAKERVEGAEFAAFLEERRSAR